MIGTTGARIATKTSSFARYLDDDVYLVFDGKPQILDDDIIRVLGRYDGTLKYETVLGAERVVPRVRVDYFHVVSER